MKIKFQADEDLKILIIYAVKRLEPAIDFRTAVEANLLKLKDVEVLERAASENRILVSHDRKTMPRHFADFIQTKTSSGLIIVGQNKNVREVAENIVDIWRSSEAEQWSNRIFNIALLNQ